MRPPAVSLSGGASDAVNKYNNNDNNNYYNHISSNAGSSSGISVNGSGYVNYGGGNTLLAQTQPALGYGQDISLVWTPEEDAFLKEWNAKYAEIRQPELYALIGKQLDKPVRDVAMRCKWLKDKEKGKQKIDDRNPKKGKEKKEKVTDSALRSLVPKRTCFPPIPFGESFRPMHGNDGIPEEAFGGALKLLTGQIAHAMYRACENINNLKFQDNISLFTHVQDDIITFLNGGILNMCDTEFMECMNRLPPLPVTINQELLDKVLCQAQSYANQS